MIIRDYFSARNCAMDEIESMMYWRAIQNNLNQKSEYQDVYDIALAT
jgi:hypothetical protein